MVKEITKVLAALVLMLSVGVVWPEPAGSQSIQPSKDRLEELVLTKWSKDNQGTIRFDWCLNETDACTDSYIKKGSPSYDFFNQLFISSDKYVPMHVVIRVLFDAKGQTKQIFSPLVITERVGEVDYTKYPLPVLDAAKLKEIDAAKECLGKDIKKAKDALIEEYAVQSLVGEDPEDVRRRVVFIYFKGSKMPNCAIDTSYDVINDHRDQNLYTLIPDNGGFFSKEQPEWILSPSEKNDFGQEYFLTEFGGKTGRLYKVKEYVQ